MGREERAAAATAAALVLTLVSGLAGAVALQRDATQSPLLAAAPAPPPTPDLPVAAAPPEPVVQPEPDPVPPPPATEPPAEPETPAPEPPPPSAPSPEAEPPVAPDPGPQQARAPPPAEPVRAAPPPAQPAAEQQSTQAQAAGPSDSERIFAGEFPVQAGARQRAGDPPSHHWAVIVGVNRYQGRTGDTLGSVADAHVLRAELLARGWRDDHILLLTDGHATHDRIVRGLEWLIRSTDERSTVVFSFSGHLRHDRGVTALWPTDNRFIWAADVGRMFGAIRAGRLWASFQGCHAEGLRAPGLEGDGRVITYSSRTAEKSYEDPEVGHSVLGWFMFAEGFRDRHADRNGDGRISVQDAWNWATPRAHKRTAGLQSPVISDGLYGQPFYLEASG